jgi:hypothetical protein
MKTLFLTVENAGIYIGIFEANLKQALHKIPPAGFHDRSLSIRKIGFRIYPVIAILAGLMLQSEV